MDSEKKVLLIADVYPSNWHEYTTGRYSDDGQEDSDISSFELKIRDRYVDVIDLINMADGQETINRDQQTPLNGIMLYQTLVHNDFNVGFINNLSTNKKEIIESP